MTSTEDLHRFARRRLMLTAFCLINALLWAAVGAPAVGVVIAAIGALIHLNSIVTVFQWGDKEHP